jgi:glycosyltransferase involved in cell wall biosynthesis
MHIIYAVNTCSNKVYHQLFAHVKRKPAYHIQKYHRLLIEGLAAHAKVDVVATPPVNRSVMDKAFVRLPRETEGGADYRYVPAIRNPVLKLACAAVGTFFRTLFLVRKDSVVIVDSLNITVALSALLAARIRGKRCVCIVTDLPEMLTMGKLARKICNFVIRHATDYVLLTEAMNDYIGNRSKPYVVLEGHSDITMRERTPALEMKLTPKTCMYAGLISKKYGLDTLVEGFRMADIPDAALHLYGPCDFEEELKQIAAKDPRVFYGGMLMNTEIVDKEMEASLLVNPRPTVEEFVKYSFPSKTMEYMSTGTPVLTTVLPGMPKEYHDYVYLLEDESAEGIARKLTELMALPEEELFQKGLAGRDFVLDTRNNVIQAQKILDMLQKTERK